MSKHSSEGLKPGELLETWLMLKQVWNDIKSKSTIAHSFTDLDKALALEPANESVKNEILELEKLSSQQKLKQRSKYIVSPLPL